jgi:hypothetical protein
MSDYRCHVSFPDRKGDIINSPEFLAVDRVALYKVINFDHCTIRTLLGGAVYLLQ